MSPEKFITGHRPDILAGISTGIVWLVILCILLLIPVSRQSQPEYTEVSIILEPSSEAVAFSGRNPREATFAAEPEQSEQTKQYDVADETAAIQDIPAGSENPLITAGTPISCADSVIIGGQHSATESPSSALTDGIGNSVQDSGRQAAGDAGFISELAAVPSEPAETAATGTRMVSGSPKMSAEILSEPVPDTTGQQQLYKSIDQLMAEQVAADVPRVSVDDVDWDSLFAEQGTTTVSDSVAVQSESGSVPTGSVLEGNAASASGKSGNSTRVSARTDPVSESNSGNSAASGETTAALDRIRTVPFTGNSVSGDVSYTVNADTINYSGNRTGTELQTADGGSLLLLEPAVPEIIISPDNEQYIDANREVTIMFTVLPSGQVNSGTITIRPASLLHPLIESEIKVQISKWRFQTSSGYGQVSFKYNIIRR